jgi:hydroxymethylglutaryl-CoA reductase
MANKTSRIPGFCKLSIEERIKQVSEFSGLVDRDIKSLEEGITLEQADRMIENVIGKVELPLGIATNFLINEREYLIPMAIDEPSVVAAASNAAKIIRESGGFKTSSMDPIMIGQIQLITDEPENARKAILENKAKILEMANEQDPTLVAIGGGAGDIDVRVIEVKSGKIVIIHLLVNVQDAMGANAVNSMAEAVAPFIEKITEGKVCLRILTNLATRRIARAECVIPKEALGGGIIDGIVNAYEFAASDIYRAATHNKGIMNGIIAVALATGNDTRAIEAGAHAYAAIKGMYSPLTKWEKNEKGDLIGNIELPLAVGTIGGATMNPVARVSLNILGLKRAQELAEVMAAVGLAQNFAALRALVSEGIQRGHMSLHAKNIAVMAGAKDTEIDKIAEVLVKEKNIKVDRAKELIKELRG